MQAVFRTIAKGREAFLQRFHDGGLRRDFWQEQQLRTGLETSFHAGYPFERSAAPKRINGTERSIAA